MALAMSKINKTKRKSKKKILKKRDAFIMRLIRQKN